ncbi:MAG: hypothetical protein AAF772_16095, partial [Acidobacteriota bacterium]
APLDTITGMEDRLSEATAILDERATLDPADDRILELTEGIHGLNAFLDIPFVTDVSHIEAKLQEYLGTLG